MAGIGGVHGADFDLILPAARLAPGGSMAAIRLAFLLPALLLAALPALAQLPEIELRKAVQYVTHGGVPLMGDIYAPKVAGKYPALIAVHGGGWQTGSRATYQYWGPFLAQRGYVLFAIDYRLVKDGKNRYPAALQDVRAAIQFLRANALEIKADPDRIGLLGESAGAQLVSLVGLAAEAPDIAGANRDDPYAAVSAKVKVVVSCYGIYDMAQQWEHDQLSRPRDQITEKFLGKAPMDDRRIYFDASPLSYAVTANNQLSFFVAYGTEDDIVDHVKQSESFVTALKQAGFPVRSVTLVGAHHSWNSEPLDEPFSYSGMMAPKLLQFLKERL